MKILSNPLLELHQGDALETLRELPADSVDCCVTSPPYWGLRDYGTASWEGGNDADCKHNPRSGKPDKCAFTMVAGKPTRQYASQLSGQNYKDSCPDCGAIRIDQQMGLEASPFEYVAKMAGVFDEVKRILKPEGTCWVVIGDSYAGSGKGRMEGGAHYTIDNNGPSTKQATNKGSVNGIIPETFRGAGSIKPKDLCGIPWRLAFALQDRGWFLRQDIIWAKPNPMPESVKDRCTRSHEYVFMLTKSARYYFNAEAIGEAQTAEPGERRDSNIKPDFAKHDVAMSNGRAGNRRDVWQITMEPYSAAHFATFPTKLVELCILAGSPAGGMILDPFGGCGTTAEVALKLGRRATLIELNPEYCRMIERNLGLFAAAI